ncbi:NAD(P)-dependent oxidoreductase [Catenulispora sp. NF23]|uniref:NAD(P)-dependent oxidoreductase n=1 Tax=Catenulispora pinistramenti TaxID=2705254 RepID=A0ABS5L087_9ACTN|nr:NAD(P)-dependent oxidoreductase [Catenulispora pinistramenti]MBS2535162.1 NAD(P)-dependent oxidoreductase [Catenulispora pinistramenti]MBS2551756.1 NAD(P)-dependent oxidoreductase [Catenulispora pinistramenti]
MSLDLPAPRRVLVTGAAGLVGRVVTRAFADRGTAVTALVLADPGDLAEAGADRVAVGDAADPDLVREALADADAVVHLAALPTPVHGTALEVFGGNTRATFNVLEEAGNRGIRRAVIASSLSILGLPWARQSLHPAYVPVDEDAPLQIEDPYGLSKQADEATAEMMARRHGMDVVALRFPFISNDERAADRLPLAADDPAIGAPELWTYLDVRDAAQATWLAVTVPLHGYHKVFAAAPDTFVPYPTADLLAVYHPDAEVRAPMPGRTAPLDLRAAQRLLGFRARHLLGVEPLPWQH